MGSIAAATLLWTATCPASALADAPATAPIAGTRLSISAEGEVARAPDIVMLNAGVVTQSTSAADAMEQNAKRMAAAIAALRAAGVANKDIRTASLTLQPQYRNTDNEPPVVTGYQASNQLRICFHDIARTGVILDALVGQGVNQIDGPNFALEHPQTALDEARTLAIQNARQRADVYAKAAGLSVKRIVTIDEVGGYAPAPRFAGMVASVLRKASTDLQPGEQSIDTMLQVTFELQ